MRSPSSDAAPTADRGAPSGRRAARPRTASAAYREVPVAAEPCRDHGRVTERVVELERRAEEHVEHQHADDHAQRDHQRHERVAPPGEPVQQASPSDAADQPAPVCEDARDPGTAPAGPAGLPRSNPSAPRAARCKHVPMRRRSGGARATPGRRPRARSAHDEQDGDDADSIGPGSWRLVGVFDPAAPQRRRPPSSGPRPGGPPWSRAPSRRSGRGSSARCRRAARTPAAASCRCAAIRASTPGALQRDDRQLRPRATAGTGPTTMTASVRGRPRGTARRRARPCVAAPARGTSPRCFGVANWRYASSRTRSDASTSTTERGLPHVSEGAEHRLVVVPQPEGRLRVRARAARARRRRRAPLRRTP